MGIKKSLAAQNYKQSVGSYINKNRSIRKNLNRMLQKSEFISLLSNTTYSSIALHQYVTQVEQAFLFECYLVPYIYLLLPDQPLLLWGHFSLL